jgi:hypothetical protein
MICNLGWIGATGTTAAAWASKASSISFCSTHTRNFHQSGCWSSRTHSTSGSSSLSQLLSSLPSLSLQGSKCSHEWSQRDVYYDIDPRCHSAWWRISLRRKTLPNPESRARCGEAQNWAYVSALWIRCRSRWFSSSISRLCLWSRGKSGTPRSYRKWT